MQEKQTLENKLKQLGLLKEQIKHLNAECENVLDHLLTVSDEITRVRKGFLIDVLENNPYVKISVIPFGAGESVEQEIRKLIQKDNGGFEKDIKSIVSQLYLNGDHHETNKELINELKDKLLSPVNDAVDDYSFEDRRFVNHLSSLPPEALDRIQLWFPEDSLKVEYSAEGDGSRFRSIHEGSRGQKTAALLAYLLSYGNEPLILDQPEDDLDNALIYSLIVNQLREIKQKRQIIIVTHNANIVVNGDAEKVIALHVARGRTQKASEGCLQEINVTDLPPTNQHPTLRIFLL